MKEPEGRVEVPEQTAEASGAVSSIPATLAHPWALRFWLSVLGTGLLAGLGAGLLTLLLEWVQQTAWGGDGKELLTYTSRTQPLRVVLTLAAAGVVTGLGQVLLRRLSSGNDIDTTAAIWFQAGRMLSFRTLGSAILSVVVVGMGVSLGREGAPKQAGAVFSNFFSDLLRLPDEQRRLLVACGAGAGMGAAYGVPLGGAIFAIEVLRGALVLRFLLPALVCSGVATAVAWTMLPNAPTYHLPVFPNSRWSLLFAVLCGVVAAPFSVLFVRAVRWAEQNKPSSWQRLGRPLLGLTALGLAAAWFPQILGNGHDISQLLFTGSASGRLAGLLLFLKPAAILLCIVCGVPGGLFTPSLTSGALLGTVLGSLWSSVLPPVPLGLCALIGAGAVVSATTQGPASTLVFMMELTGYGRLIVLPLLLAQAASTLIARSIEPRSIYDARLSNEQVRVRQQLRDKAQIGPG